MRDANPQTIYLKDYRPPEYLIHSVDLNFELDEESTRIVSTMVITRNPKSQQNTKELVLSGENLKLISITLDTSTLEKEQYSLDQEHLIINDVPQDKTFTLTIENLINPKANTALEGLYLSNDMLCTQCEAEGFRKITYFLDRPDIMTHFTTTLTGNKHRYPVLLSNGNKVAQGDLPNNRHWVTWNDPFNKPCYLFALVAGQLECLSDHFITQSGREISLQIFVEARDLDKCSHAMESLKKAMQWDEQVYGREYDLDLYMIVAVGHFNMGAMENKGLNIFNTKYVLARPDTATDSDYEHIEGVIAHEYFHNWTGNRITCRDWFQLSLKEGLTVFRDQEFTADQTSKAVKRIEDVNMLRTRQFAEDAGPLAHPIRPDSYIEINNFYTLTVYEKGAEVVRMQHTLLGEERFRKGTDLYFQRHDGQAVTCDDFVQAMEDANDVDLEQFRLWYSQAGTPELSVQQQYDVANQSLALTINQSCLPTPGQTQKQALHIPIKLGFLDSKGSPMQVLMQDATSPTLEVIIELKQQEQSFVFTQLPDKPIVSLLRGFSAPVKLTLDRNLEELAFLLSHDPDTFNRWEAGQQLASQIILGLVKDIQTGNQLQLNPIIIDSFRHLMKQSWDDLSYFSLLLSLPGESYLAEQMSIVDVVAIHQAREFVKQSLAEQLSQQFLTHYQNHHKDDSGKFDSHSVGSRRIKNTCLDYLSKLESEEAYEIAEKQFRTANNMTDQITALSTIVNSQHPEKTLCLNNFYDQWQNEALVIDKWFSLQASSTMPDTFTVIQKLMQHPAFDLKTPNRVRALIGAFAQGNPLHFHAENGQGYQFLADQVIALNEINPQVASRMLSALTHWHRFDENRQNLMKLELKKIIHTEDISKDVYEVASKSLL
jgi:aminopeptidase N